jgi:hypothetical protein
MHIYCETERAIILIGLKDVNGVFRFPTDAEGLHGIMLSAKVRTPIVAQIVERVESYFSKTFAGGAVDITPDFAGKCTLSSGESVTLYAGVLRDDSLKADESWQTLPAVLRNMPKDKNRVAYLLALQVFAGTGQESVKAVASENLLIN